MPIGNSNNDSRIYLNVTKGQFKYRLGKDQPYEFANFVQGKYLYHTFAYKENKDKPTFSKWVLQIALKDEQEGQLYLVESTAINLKEEATVFFWMWASFLDAITPGDDIRVRTWVNDDNENVSVCWVESQTESGWEALTRTQFGEDKTETAKYIVTHHAGYLSPEAAKKVKGNGDEGEDDGGEEAGAQSPATPSEPQPATTKPKAAKKGATAVAPEVDEYFNLIEELGLNGMDIRDHTAIVGRCYSFVEGLTAEEGAALKSFNDVDPRAVAALTANLRKKVETIKAFPLVSDTDWVKVPKQIREFMEARAAKEKPATPAEADPDPFEEE